MMGIAYCIPRGFRKGRAARSESRCRVIAIGILGGGGPANEGI